MGTSAPYDAPSSWSDLKGNITRAARQRSLRDLALKSLIRSLIAHNGGRNEMARGSRRAPADLLVLRHRHGMLLRDWVLSSRMSVPLDLQRPLLSSGLGDFRESRSQRYYWVCSIDLAGIRARLMRRTLDRLSRTCKKNYLPKRPMQKSLRPYCSMRPRTSKTFLNGSSATTSSNNSVACPSNVWCSGWEISRHKLPEPHSGIHSISTAPTEPQRRIYQVWTGRDRKVLRSSARFSIKLLRFSEPK